MKIKTNSSSLETTGEGFGILLSQFGFQQSYDSESQQKLGIDDMNVNPTAVQGWNGVAFHRIATPDPDSLTIEFLSL